MPTQLDRTLQSKASRNLPMSLLSADYASQNLFFGFAGLVTAVAAWTIWGPGDMFPKQDPAGEFEQWSDAQLKQYLIDRRLAVGKAPTREELVAMVKASKQAPK
ncbi:Hypothetical protein D9617_2g053000 [Elsinoe fawcettii]|nr:Hypothetical protein D9617_2g053000 [Elsinoe fawcettii]